MSIEREQQGTRGSRVGDAENGRAGRPALPAIIGPAQPGDVPAIAALLRAAEMPHEDFAAHLAQFLVARDEHGGVIGAVGAEVHAPDALLRSLVVAPAARGTGLGAELVRRIEIAAGGWRVERWWLLTTTAEKFFGARGFVGAPRASAPAAIRATGQFNGGCCCSAVCLSRERRTGG